jgi:hypothetical protein
VAAWAVNQLARRHPDELGRLLALGHDLEEAHEGLLSGGRSETAVTAGRRRREAVAALTDTAMDLLTESGRAADAHRDAIADTLDAASLDPRSAAVVQTGRLTRELDPPSGFGLDWVADDWSPPPRRAPQPDPDEPDEAPAESRHPIESSGVEEAEARRAAQVAAAEAAAAAAQEEAARAASAAADAEAEVERLERELDEAKAAARTARRASADAAARARKAAAGR